MTGKWKSMGKKYFKDVMLCPKCKSIFVNRDRGCCPSCKIRLVYPGEGFYPEMEGYVWLKEWKKISEVDINGKNTEL